MKIIVCLLLSWSLAMVSSIAQVPDNTMQLMVTVTDGWNTHRGEMMKYVRSQPGGPWQPAQKAATPVLLGKNGLAWGRGLLPVPHGENGIPTKKEKDGRAPAGCFKLGMLFGYAPQKPTGSSYPYYQVTARDCWIDDVTHEAYNKHVVVNPDNPPPWYEKQHMRLGDFAYEWLLEIRHNASPPVAGAGSAIFFHVRRGPDRATFGCTTMARENLLALINWLQPQANPCYVLLPKTEYAARRKAWHLP